MMKKEYIQPEFEILLLEQENVISTSATQEGWDEEFEDVEESGYKLSAPQNYTYGGW